MDQHGKHRALVIAGAVVAGLAAAAPVHACRLALALAMDVSSSVDAGEDRLQRHGLAAALTAPEVQVAFLSAPQPVAIAVYEWSGRYNQTILIDWRLIGSADDLGEMSRQLRRTTRSSDDFPTAMGYALGFGAGLLRRAPDCLRQTLDMAGDGENNDGFPPAAAYRAFPFGGTVVNGLVVNGADYEAEISLIEFYRAEVLHGPGAFLEIAQGFEDYERAMRRKLVREVSVLAIGTAEAAPSRPPG